MSGPVDYVDSMWGPLTVDRERLAEKLAQATTALYEASQAAQYRTESLWAINSSWADLLGGLSTVVDALIDEMEEPKFPHEDSP